MRRKTRCAALLAFRAPRELSKKLTALASARYETRSNLIRRLVAVGLEAERKRHPEYRDEVA